VILEFQTPFSDCPSGDQLEKDYTVPCANRKHLLRKTPASTAFSTAGKLKRELNPASSGDVAMSSVAAPSAPRIDPAPPRMANCVIRYFTDEIVVPPSAYTLAGFRAWAVSDEFPQRGRVSFLDGELVIDMSPEELNVHAQVKVEVSSKIYMLVKKSRLGLFYADRALLTNEDAELSTEPDSVFATWKTLQAERLRLVPLVNDPLRSKELQGTPDWVLEIVSDSSVQKDTQRLRVLYHRAGIPEYWLIDARGSQIDFQILLRGKADYEPAETTRGGWQKSTVFKKRVRLKRQREQLNQWSFDLEIKPLR
jgi:Uma2 family endonuclease